MTEPKTPGAELTFHSIFATLGESADRYASDDGSPAEAGRELAQAVEDALTKGAQLRERDRETPSRATELTAALARIAELERLVVSEHMARSAAEARIAEIEAECAHLRGGLREALAHVAGLTKTLLAPAPAPAETGRGAPGSVHAGAGSGALSRVSFDVPMTATVAELAAGLQALLRQLPDALFEMDAGGMGRAHVEWLAERYGLPLVAAMKVPALVLTATAVNLVVPRSPPGNCEACELENGVQHERDDDGEWRWICGACVVAWSAARAPGAAWPGDAPAEAVNVESESESESLPRTVRISEAGIEEIVVLDGVNPVQTVGRYYAPSISVGYGVGDLQALRARFVELADPPPKSVAIVLGRIDRAIGDLEADHGSGEIGQSSRIWAELMATAVGKGAQAALRRHSP